MVGKYSLEVIYLVKAKVEKMNSIKHFFKHGSVSNRFLNVYKGSLARESINTNRLPVRTPFSHITDKNVLQSKWFSRNTPSDFIMKLQRLIPRSPSAIQTQRDIHDISSLKKRPGFRKKRSEHQEKMAKDGYFNVVAYATAEEYDLEKLLTALKTQDLYAPKKMFNSDDNNENEPDVLYASAKYQIGTEPREIYFFREGTVVMWNCSDMESSNVLGFLKDFEQVSFSLPISLTNIG